MGKKTGLGGGFMILGRSSVFVAIFLMALSFWVEAEPAPQELAEVRDKLNLPTYSSAQKKLLVEQALMVMDQLFVHRDIKAQDFGKSTNPVPRLEAILKDVDSIENDKFHAQMSQIFTDVHDLHTNYFAPTPTTCGYSFIPVRFEWVKDGSRDAILVSRKLKLNTDLIKDIKIDDELEELDSKPIFESLKELENISGGANPDAMRMRGVQLLSFRNFMIQAVPKENKVKLKFKGAKDPIELPWLASVDKNCLGSRMQNRMLMMPLAEAMNQGEDEFQRRFNEVFKPETLAPAILGLDVNLGPLKEVFEISEIPMAEGSLGYIRLKTFHWQNRNLDMGTVVEGLRRSVEEYLANTEGLVIDVRSNPGGLITFAEKIVQLFSPLEVHPNLVRMLANPLNEEIFLNANGKDNRWSLALKKAMDKKEKFIESMPITPFSEANNFGQVWYKPVVVLTDASCYSACDMFAASMQDSGAAAAVIGIHRNTGGGGANVMEHAVFRNIMMFSRNNPFRALPYGQNMRVAWRQSVRTGKNAGQLIENQGVKSDTVIALKKEDIGSESKELMRTVQTVITNLKSKYQSGLGGRRGGLVLLENKKETRWTEQVYGVDSVELLIHGKTLATNKINPSKSPKAEEFRLEKVEGEWTDQQVVLIGKLEGGKVFRTVRELMWRGDYEEIPENGIEVGFEDDGMGPLHKVLLRGAKGSGWTLAKGKLRIGNGPQYEPRVLARAFAPLQLNGKGGKMVFDLSLQAEDTHDSLRIYAINPDTGERKNFFAASNFNRRNVSYALPKEWKRADVVFEFESDENWNMAGPLLDNVRFLN